MRYVTTFYLFNLANVWSQVRASPSPALRGSQIPYSMYSRSRTNPAFSAVRHEATFVSWQCQPTDCIPSEKASRMALLAVNEPNPFRRQSRAVWMPISQVPLTTQSATDHAATSLPQTAATPKPEFRKCPLDRQLFRIQPSRCRGLARSSS